MNQREPIDLHCAFAEYGERLLFVIQRRLGKAMASRIAPEDVLQEDYLGRLRIGDEPDIRSFAAGYPHLEKELIDILPLVVGMERIGQHAEASEDAIPPPDLTRNGYRIIRKLGVGGMGVVYEAEQVALNRKVAIKLLRPSLFSDPELQELFRREARILALFHHPGIVRIIDTGKCDETLFYVMELSEGQRMDALPGQPDEATVLKWGIATADALVCAHEHGIIHADIKPANLLLGGSGSVRIADFGLALFSRERADGDAARNGTRRFMAPERKDGNVCFAGDQYALGATLVELLSHQPFDPTVGAEALNCNRDFRAVIRKSLQSDPDRRYPTMRKFADDLLHVQRHEPIAAEPVSWVRQMILFCRRRPLWAACALLCILFSCAQTRSLVKGHAALVLARDNARTANTAISQVFDRIVDMPPSSEDVALLTALLPHYEKIVANPNIPQKELEDALMNLARTALRTGNYGQAEKALRRLLAYGETSKRLRLLSVALEEQGRTADADNLRRQLAERYASKSATERLDSIWALQRLPPCDENDNEILARLRVLLAERPPADEALSLYAHHLLKHPEIGPGIEGVPNDPLLLLDDLSDRHPNTIRYALRFVQAVTDRIRTSKAEEWFDRLDSSLMKSDLLIGRFQNHPTAVSSAIALRRSYANWLRGNGSRRDAMREHQKIRILISMLFNQPDFPDSEKGILIDEQLSHMEDWREIRAESQGTHGRRHFHGQQDRHMHFEQDLRNRIETYDGPRKDEFLRRINDLFTNPSQGDQSKQK